MNRTLALATALAAGLATSSAFAQAAATPAAPAPAAAPQAIPAKIAVIAFEQVVVATNEGQRAVADIQKKYEPKKNAIDAQAKRLRVIDTKEKNLQRDAEDAQTSYQNDLQEAIGKVAQKVGGTAVKYAQDNGFTILLNVGGQQANPVLWEAPQTDISQAVVNAYNVASGVAAPPPSAPTPARKTAAPSK
jgi:outer membrane protein